MRLAADSTRAEQISSYSAYIHLGEAVEGMREIAEGQVTNPAPAERYLASKLGKALEPVRTAMQRVASAFSPDELEAKGLYLYEQFRPEVPEGEGGWGATMQWGTRKR